ncbi:ATP-dependent helicase HrpB [Sandaracinobacter sp. RS1-74]|uniref:ATP-dependent helicase HrpB n=1 Tax=Sandaracinobacteroides sayramensis TaxID=2913411 RepID=UPI001EDA93DD|nr:ATP-dependent helicase HrpB [Sandaracinobacteroides sayramensis]MCG2840272.1 ATP-dependent helicase HrpB [Sandaracinobacteroides sayramensis]
MPDLMATGLPVTEVLPTLHQSLAHTSNAVLVAPPGAGKTTLVAPSLLGAPWLRGGRIFVMLPRRLAARAAAERIAGLLGEAPGERVGYRTRLESKPGSRIECLTEGLFVNRLIADPGLEGIGALLFDEVHERNLEGDLGLALALDAQQLRPDLRILAMSATLDGGRFAKLMGDAPVLQSDGRSFPVEIRHLGRSEARIEDRMASAIRAALGQAEGSLLAFLPGVAEIERTAERLQLPDGVALHKLHGQADPAAQRAALKPGGRRVVLATSIAETSLTIDGVTVVLDSGLARRPRYDRASGLTRLVTERVSQAAATQRAGRAGRQAPGVAIRLWAEGETRGLIPFDPPEILEADLAQLLLRLAAWGVRDPGDLEWLDPPPASAVAAARADLQALGALDEAGGLTPHGRRMGALPVSPRIAHLLLEGAARGQAEEAATLALLLEERGLGGPSADMEERLRRFATERSPRAGQSRRLAERWAAAASRLQAEAGAAPLPVALLLATAFPDRVARRRRAPGASDQTADYLMANGRGVALDASDPLAKSEWLAIADAGGAGASSRVRLAAAIPQDALPAWLEGRTAFSESLAPDPASGRLALLRVERLGAIEVARRRAAATPEAMAAALKAEVVAKGLAALDWPEAELALLARLRFASANGCEGLPDSSEEALLESADLWLLPRLQGVSRLSDAKLEGALSALIDWPAGQSLERFAPARFQSPAGTSHAIDYAADGGPEVEVRVQAVFGLGAHPMLANGRVPLTLALTSPAGRPVAKTRDLSGFWKGAWKDVQRDMKGRYPRHPWPDDPAQAAATVRTKAADARRGHSDG